MKKKRDVFIKVLSEVMEQPEEAVSVILDEFITTIQGQIKFDETLSQEEYDELLNSLRKEKDVIKSWLRNSQYRDFLSSVKPQGNA